MPVIDAHHHFWSYNAVDYGWIPDTWSALRRDYLPPDLARESASTGVDGVISVQARQSLEETAWLLDFAARHAFVRGVVGWAPLIAADLSVHLDHLATHPAAAKLRAFRHVLQAEPDDAYMLRDDFNHGVIELTRRGYAYDILILERHLPQAIAFVDRHPDATFVLDHIAKPRIAASELEPWAQYIREIARRPNVACKLSGMVTEADINTWTPAQLQPYFDVVLDAFGPTRLLYGSDWPVCLAGVGYARWKEVIETALTPLSNTEKHAILGGNALRIYKIT
jgi:L-fuconolactonase